MEHQLSFGAWLESQGTRFRVWAPTAQTIEVVVQRRDTMASYAMERRDDGSFMTVVPGIGAGTRYKYRLNGEQEFPDPASRFQPEGVHGPSLVVDPSRFRWVDSDWKGLPREHLIIYELHVGTFTPEGTFQAALRQLPVLRELGVTAIELMPLADFPGQRNWGYDGVALFAPAHFYGTPEDLRLLVDTAHQLGLAVLLDVVYNHFGPDGNYLAAFSPYWVSPRHSSPWGAALNFDGPHSVMLREYFFANALCWLHDFHFDGLRLDATHAIQDDSRPHFLAELSARVRQGVTGRQVHLIAEDHRNLAHMVKSLDEGGWGLDAVWADDFHHEVRRLLAGDFEGYYQDYTGTTTDLATTIEQGWFFSGQHSHYLGHPRGTNAAGIPLSAFVICLQNHDQIGNRALGERLSHQVDLAAYRAAAALLLCAPETPLLFMGQEWAASSPFLFFTDHHAELGQQVTEGRRREFRHFAAFTDPASWGTIPDPQAEATFLASKLRWEECDQEPHRGIWRLHQALLQLRQSEPALRSGHGRCRCAATGDYSLVLHRWSGQNQVILFCCFKGSGVVRVPADPEWPRAGQPPWRILLSTEDARFGVDSRPIPMNLSGGMPAIDFPRPGAVLLGG